MRRLNDASRRMWPATVGLIPYQVDRTVRERDEHQAGPWSPTT